MHLIAAIPELSLHHDYETRFLKNDPQGISLGFRSRQIAVKTMAASESAKPLNVIMDIPLLSDESGSSQSDGEECLAKRLESKFFRCPF